MASAPGQETCWYVQKKWRATVLQQAKDGFLPSPPEPPDSEFLENSARVSAMNFSFPDPVLDPAPILCSTPILADGDLMIEAVQELLREVQTPDHYVKLSPPPSEHELKEIQLDSVNHRSLTAEETSQRICHWDAQVNMIKLHSELNDEQFSKFLHFSQTVAEPTPEVFPAHDRCVRAVIEADSVMPDSERYRHWVYERFKDTVLGGDGNTWDEILKNISARGPQGICTLQPIPGAVRRAYKAIRAVEEREEALRAKVDEFLKKGWIQPSHSPWVSRGFLVPKPDGKWRLVIDYRYVNTQRHGHEFPLPVIEDMLLRQQANRLWTLLDLEEGLNKRHSVRPVGSILPSALPGGCLSGRYSPWASRLAHRPCKEWCQTALNTCSLAPCPILMICSLALELFISLMAESWTTRPCYRPTLIRLLHCLKLLRNVIPRDLLINSACS